jgi:hypothetical protein
MSTTLVRGALKQSVRGALNQSVRADCSVIIRHILFVLINLVIVFSCLTASGCRGFYYFIQFNSFGNYKCLGAFMWCRAPLKVSFFLSICLRVKQLEENSTDFYEISCMGAFFADFR